MKQDSGCPKETVGVKAEQDENKSECMLPSGDLESSAEENTVSTPENLVRKSSQHKEREQVKEAHLVDPSKHEQKKHRHIQRYLWQELRSRHQPQKKINKRHFSWQEARARHKANQKYKRTASSTGGNSADSAKERIPKGLRRPIEEREAENGAVVPAVVPLRGLQKNRVIQGQSTVPRQTGTPSTQLEDSEVLHRSLTRREDEILYDREYVSAEASAPPSESPTSPTVVAELVDETAEAEIDSLRQELEGLREQQRQQNSQIVIAEPLQQSAMNSAPRRLVNPKKQIRAMGADLHNEIAIYEPAREIEESQGKTSSPTHLQAGTLKLHDRDEETDILRECLNDLNLKQLVIISGYSGCGKTALASSLKPIVLEQQGLFVSGKYDLYLRDQPYFGIRAACQEICIAIMSLRTSHSQTRSFQEIHGYLKTALPPQHSQILSTVIPQLREILDYYEKCPRLDNPAMFIEQSEEAKNQLHFAFRHFIQVISNYFSPFVIMLDDLQWADAASVELIQIILTDQANPSFLMIGLYRSNEVCTEVIGIEPHILTTLLQDLKEKREEINLAITEMEIGNLKQGAVQAVVMDLLAIQAATPKVMELALVCFKRTLGNVFFLIAFVTMLEDEGLLEYDTQTNIYSWDIEKIKYQTGATSNLVDLMKEKMVKLPTEIGQLLSMAACLGPSFERAELELVFRLFDPARRGHADYPIQEEIAIAVAEGFWESLDAGSSKYRWIHDKIQDAALTLIPREETNTFKGRIGQVLCQEMDGIELNEHLFLIVNLLNEIPKGSLNKGQQIHLADLNLQATKKAMSCSAFSSASSYAKKGIEYLPSDRWTSHYRLTLCLYSSVVESRGLLGQHDTMNVYCNEVLAQSNCPVPDKVPVYTALVTQMMNSGKFAEVVDLLLEVLGSLGCKFPTTVMSRHLATFSGIVKLKLKVKRLTSTKIAGLAIMENPVEIGMMKLLDRLTISCYYCRSNLLPLAVIKSACLTLGHGMCNVSSTSFTKAATFLIMLGDHNAGFALGSYALEIEKRFKYGVSVSQIKMELGCYVFPWCQPLQQVCCLLSESYSEGLISGEADSATMAIQFYLRLCAMAGRPLKQIGADCAVYRKQMKELRKHVPYVFATLTWQWVHNMMGIVENPILIQGEVLTNLEEFIDKYHGIGTMMELIRTFQLRLYVLYGEYQMAANLFKAHGFDWLKIHPGHPQFMETIFTGGIASFAMARSTGKRTYKKYAMKARSIVKRWIRQNNPNCAHQDALFDAELAALQRRNKRAEKKYQSAIVIAAHGGYIHDAALANERYGEFMLSELSNQECAAFHFKEAIRLYEEWGAAKKVQLLQEKYASVLTAQPNNP